MTDKPKKARPEPKPEGPRVSLDRESFTARIPTPLDVHMDVHRLLHEVATINSKIDAATQMREYGQLVWYQSSGDTPEFVPLGERMRVDIVYRAITVYVQEGDEPSLAFGTRDQKWAKGIVP